jgi:hypothetical protein
MKNFFNLLGVEVQLNDIKFFVSFDFIDDILLNFLINIENSKIILFIGLNLRVEIPILSSRLMKYNNIKFYNIGHINTYSLLKIKNISNNIFDFLTIFRGKNVLNIHLFFKSYLASVYINFIKLTNICFFFGQSFYNIENNFFLFNYSKYFFNKFFINSFNLNLFSNVGVINLLLVGGYYSFKNDELKRSSFVFFEALDEILSLNKITKFIDNFIVYRGSFFENGAKISDLIFPSLTFFEEKNFYYNYNGVLKNTKKIIHNEYNIIQNFYVYLMNFYKFYFLNNYCYINSLFKIIKFFNFLDISFKFVAISNTFNFKILSLNSKKFYENILLSTNIFNFYKSDVYSRNSKNLHLASLDYLKLINIYN